MQNALNAVCDQVRRTTPMTALAFFRVMTRVRYRSHAESPFAEGYRPGDLPNIIPRMTDAPDQLREAVEKMHRGTATLAQSVQAGMGRRGARVRLSRASDRDPRLRLVLADRGQHEAPVLRHAASAASR